MKRLITGLVMAGLIMPHLAVALDARTSMLMYASAGNVQALNGMVQQGYSFEMMDARGNTPVCEAALRGDQRALNVLVAMGANPKPPCWNNLPPQVAMQMQPQPMVAHVNMTETPEPVAESVPVATSTQTVRPITPRKRVPVYAPTKKAIDWSIPSWVGWLGIAGLVGGAAVLIAGSGSSHSTGNDEHKCDGYPLVLIPANASYESCEIKGKKRYKIISCNAGYVLANNTCSAKGCTAYTLTSCPKHGVCSKCTEVTGQITWKLDSCETNYTASGNNCVYSACSSYPLSSCPTHGHCSQCPSADPDGGAKTFKLDSCDPEYTISNNTCVRNSGTKLGDRIGKNSAVSTDLKSDTRNSDTYWFPGQSIFVDSVAYQDVYGIKNTADKQINNAYTSEGVKSPGSVTIQIRDSKDGNVYGIYSIDSSKKGTAFNARSVGGETTTNGTIDISKSNSSGLINSNVYGLYGGVGVNAYLIGTKDKVDKDTSGTIIISKTNNEDNTVLAGVYGNSWAANAIKSGYGGKKTDGSIELTHSGSGNVYGVQGLSYAYNAVAVPAITDSNISSTTHGTGYLMGNAHGRITIETTRGTANVYGIYSGGRAANGWRDGNGSGDGYNDSGVVQSYIIIDNNGDGTVAGVYSTGGGAYNYYGYHGTEATASIRINSTGKGIVYGLKSDHSSSSVYNVYSSYTGIREIPTSGNKNDNGEAYTNATVAAATIQLGATGVNTNNETVPTSALESDNDAYGIYARGSARNASMSTGEISLESSGADKNHTQSVRTQGKIYVFHKTPATGSANSKLNIVGMEAAGDSFNAYGNIKTNVRTAAVTGNIEVREMHLSAGEVKVKGVEFTGAQNHTFYNAYFESDSSVTGPKGSVTGAIYVNGQTGCTATGKVEAYGIASSGDVYNAYSDSTTTGGAVTGSIIVRGKDVSYGIWLNNGYIGYNASASSSKATVTGKITATTSTGVVAGMKTNSGVFYNARHGATGDILVSATGAGNRNNAYGMYSGDGAMYNASGATSIGTIDVLYRGTGQGIGMYGNAVSSGAGTSVINVTLVPGLVTESGVLKAKGDAIGMYAMSGYAVNGRSLEGSWTDAEIQAAANTVIKINSIGPLYTTTDNAASNSTAVAVENDTSRAIGMYAKKGATITNNAKIEIVREDYAQRPNAGGDVTRTWKPATSGNSTGRAIGMYHEGGGGTVNNNGNITVTGSIQDAVSHNNYGIYVQDGTNTTVNNTGTIHVGANGYGIYIASNGSKATVTNTGGILIGYTDPTNFITNVVCVNGVCKDIGEHTVSPGSAIVFHEETAAPVTTTSQYIYLGGGTLTNESLISSVTPIDFDDMGGEAAISTGGTYEAPSLKGSLFVSNDVTKDSFDTTYTLHDALKADDVSDVLVKSKSALFTANKDSNGSDITLTMKKFADFENTSVANFFDKNYALKQNAKLFNILKNAGSAKELRAQMKSLTGQNMFGRMNFEDMSVLKELNFSMNNNLFTKKMQSFKLADTVTPSLVRGGKNANVRYSLMNRQMGNKSVGVGIAFIDTRNADSHDKDTRTQSMYQMVVPFGYTKNKVSMVMAPRLGYARGNYDRTGFGKTYDGKIEKRVYGVTNEARYDFKLGDWTLTPAAEFNVMGYQQKGHEDKKEFSLTIPTQNTLSIESGIGFYASNEQKLSHGTLNLNAGVMAYHEFADPYRLDVRMNEMQGHYTISDDSRGAHRVLLRAGFNYKTDDLDVYGNVISEFSKNLNTSARTGVRVNF